MSKKQECLIIKKDDVKTLLSEFQSLCGRSVTMEENKRKTQLEGFFTVIRESEYVKKTVVSENK